MDRESIHEILKLLEEGKIKSEQALSKLALRPFVELEEIIVDSSRSLRKKAPETVFCLGKTPEQVKKSFIACAQAQPNVLGTKASKEQFEAVKESFEEAEYFSAPRVIRLVRKKVTPRGKVIVVSAGSSDLPIAEEAVLSAEFFGSHVELVTDVGVAGVHRVRKVIEKLEGANAIVCCAGMEGALPSLVAGIVSVPVIGVPTSIGYGTSFGGISALLSMLNSCAEGLAVVNIDNGFGAGYLANMINLEVERAKGNK